jgi:hypothetical protein
MRNGLEPVDSTTEYLVRSALSMRLTNQITTYIFDFLQVGRIPCPNDLDAYRLSMIISLPGIRESVGCVIRGIVAQFHVREDSGFKEEGVGIQSGPQHRQGMS